MGAGMDDAGISDISGEVRRWNKVTKVLMCGPFALSGGVSTHTKNLSKCLSELGIKIILFNLSGKNIDRLEGAPLRKIYQRTLGLTYESIKKRKEYDIIHIQASGGVSSFISAITGCFLSKLLNKKLIVTFHHSQTEKFVNKYKILFGFVLKRTEKLILVSYKQKNAILSFFPRFSYKIIVIPNGYVSALFYPRIMEECRKTLNLPINKKIIFNVSNLVEVKGHRYLIEAMKEIMKHRKDVLCFIGGAGYLKDELETFIKKLDLEDYVTLIGWRPDEEIPIWMNACNIFVLPSSAEGNPIVMFECLGCEKPFVGTNVGGIPEIIISEDYGLLCEPANPEELAKNILLALDKEWDAMKLETYSAQFTWDAISKETLNVYSKLYSINLDI